MTRLQPYVLQAKLVIEVDGPSHYTHHELSPRQGGPPVEVNGPTRMKVRRITPNPNPSPNPDPDPDPDH